MNPILKLQMTASRPTPTRKQVQTAQATAAIHNQVAKAYEFAQDVREARAKRAHLGSQEKVGFKSSFIP